MRWTLKRLQFWLLVTWAVDACPETIRKALRGMGLSWKKAKKLLSKANPQKRQHYLDKLNVWLEQAARGERVLVFIDEAHIHQDVENSYGWFKTGSNTWLPSSSPGLAAKVSFYGVYYYNEGMVEMRPYKKANETNTVEVLWYVAKRARKQGVPVSVIWDGAPYHRSHWVKRAAETFGVELVQLPGYSPDLMPVEALWLWLRQQVSSCVCFNTRQDLIDAVLDFQNYINQLPYAVADRLVVLTELDQHVEQLRVSM